MLSAEDRRARIDREDFSDVREVVFFFVSRRGGSFADASCTTTWACGAGRGYDGGGGLLGGRKS